MEIYTVSFFGHRLVERASEIQVRLEILLHDLMTQKEYGEFLIGREGEFDLLAASSIRRAVKQYGYSNTSIVLVLPYMKAEYRDNEQSYLDYYDEVGICADSSEVHYKSAIQVRNRCMVDRSDLVVLLIVRHCLYILQGMLYQNKMNSYHVFFLDYNLQFPLTLYGFRIF